MTTDSPLYRIVSAIISVTLVVQLLAPAWGLTHADTLSGDDPNQEPSRVASSDLQTAGSVSPSLSQPLSISRVQSSYQTGSNVTITYTVTNNQVPTLLPDISDTATSTDTLDILATFAITDDVNTLRGVALTSTLTADATFVTASGTPIQNGQTNRWDLPDIPPLGSATITLTVQGPANAAAFTDLDTGAVSSAILWNGPVSDTARPAAVIPDSIDPATMRSTEDADRNDKDMLWKTAEFTQDPLLIFDYVQSFQYDPYRGSLRGTRGTLWGQAGNAIDQASLLIAALRASGVPARYRHGTLDSNTAQMLINSMFSEPDGVGGYLPSGIEHSDPANDAALIALVSDHWWAEAYLPGSGWTDLDPSFPNGTVGQLFVTTIANDGSDGIVELPDSLRHQVRLSLEVEQYNSFPIGGSNLSRFTPLTATYSTAELASKPVSLGHLVTSETPLGMVFSTITHVYSPYFAVDGDGFITTGDEFQDVLSNFPLSSYFTTAEWLTVEVEDVDGGIEAFTRDLKDLIGLDVRLNGGALNLALPADNRPFTSIDDSFTSWFLPNQVRDQRFVDRSRAENLQAVVATASTAESLPTAATTVTPEEREAISNAQLDYLLVRDQQYALAGLDFALFADATAADLEENLSVKLYYENPRIIITSSRVNHDDTVQTALDLRSTEAATLVYPGQATEGAFTANWIKAIAESTHEGATIERLTGAPALTTARIFDEMNAQGIDPVLITATELDLLDLYLPDPAAYAYAVEALLEGKTVLIPSQPVTVDGEDVLGWWEIDPQTGTVVSVLENGLHSALIEYDMLVAILGASVDLKAAAGLQKAVADLWNCIVKYVVPALQGTSTESGKCVTGPPVVPGYPALKRVSSSPWQYLPAHLCPVDNCGIEQFLLPEIASAQIPLPEMRFNYRDQIEPRLSAGRIITASDNGSGGPPALTLGSTPGSGSVLAGEVHQFDLTADANFDGRISAWLYAPDGWQVEFDETTLIASAVAPPGTAPDDYALHIVGQAEAFPDLIATAQHTMTISSSGLLELSDAVEPNITVSPDDPLVDTASNQTNDGEAEMPASAYRLGVLNGTTQNKTITLTASVPAANASWIVLNGSRQLTTSFDLEGNERTRVGLYVSPPTLPSPGVSFFIDVQLTDGAGMTDNTTINWTMPGQPFNFLSIEPETLYVGTNDSVDFAVNMANVGNDSGSFPLTATVPVTSWSVSPLQSPLSLAVGETASPTATLTVVNGQIGQVVPLQAASQAQNSYTQYAFADVRIVSPESEIIFDAANSCNLGQDAISASLESLALSVVELEQWCQVGDCPLQLRDRVVSDINDVVIFAQAASSSVTAGDALLTVATDMSTHTDNAAIAADISALSSAITALEGELCEIGQHLPTARFSPTLDAILLGQSTTYTLTVTNEGTMTTTYAITATLPGGDTLLNPTIPAGATVDLPLPMTPASLGFYGLAADVVATGAGVGMDISTQANAWLNVVDKFVQVTAVTADPPLVETGVSSTDLSVDVTNVAYVARDTIARTTILAPGGAISYTTDLTRTVLSGSPRTYPLATVDTSGWSAGIYTVTVDLLDGAGLLIPDGHGYGYFAVGQAMVASQAVRPPLVAPGTVTVTTIITTEIVANTILSRTQAGPLWTPTGLRAIDDLTLTVDDSNAAHLETALQMTGTEQTEDARNSASSNTTPRSIRALSTASAISRTEQIDPGIVYVGNWSQHPDARASSGNYHRGTGPVTATFTFNGSWVNIGFLASPSSGMAEIHLDGASLDVIDLYRREETAVSYIYDGLISATHTISISALSTTNPFAGNNFVQLDFFDTWDGTTFPDGTFEQDDPRVYKGTGWSTVNTPVASSGTYMWDNRATAWFPFTGDSVTYQAIGYNSGGKARVYLDGVYQTTLDMYSPAPITRSLSYTGLVPGPHILQINHYRGRTTIDAFITPANGNHHIPPSISGFSRFEEDDPAMLYNGVPFTITKQSWSRSDSISYAEASDGQYISSRTVSDTVSFTFAGVWASIGFFTSDAGGQAEIFLDGFSKGIVDLYSNEEGVASLSYPNLPAGTHTISVTVLGTANPFSRDQFVYVDYVDVWDGNPLPAGKFEQDDVRVLRSGGWIDSANAGASGGSFMEEVLQAQSTFWLPFTGDSITYQAFNYFRSDEVSITIDENFLGYYDVRDNSGVPTITHSFDNLGPGLHILKVQHYRDEANSDAIYIPAMTPTTPPPVAFPITRAEEDDPAMMYDGFPYALSNRTWNRRDNIYRASDSQYIYSSNAGDWVSFDFSGTWVNVGFITSRQAGQTEIFIDGISQGIIDLFTADDNVHNVVYAGLTDSNHTISMTILSTRHPNSTGNELMFDYIDTWDGSDLPSGRYEEDHPQVVRSHDYDDWAQITQSAASGGAYVANASLTADHNAWFGFTGDSVTFVGLANNQGNRTGFSIDGIWQGDFNLYSSVPVSRNFTFAGLGAGPHVLRVNQYRGTLNVDAFVTPGFGPITQTPVYTGVIRFEEDDPALVYNGQDSFSQRPTSWGRNTSAQTSNNWNVRSNTVGDSVALTFDGRWVNVGFRTRNQTSQAEIFIDGLSQGTLDLDNNAGEDVLSVPFGDLITGTHTISMVVAAGTVYFDFFDVWDGNALPDDLVDIRLSEDSGRLHYSSGLGEGSHANAISGDFVFASLLNTNSNIWYTFTGDSFTYFGLSRNNTTNVDLYVDGVLLDSIDQSYPFSEQPIDYHYSGLTDGPHVVRVHNGVYLRSDAFQSNPDTLAPYQPRVEWYDNAPNGGTGSFGMPAGMIMGIAAGDIDGNGEVEIIAPSDTYTTGGFINSIFIYRGDGQDAGNGTPLIRRIDFAALGIASGRETIGSVALADLDGQPGAEIIVGSERGMYAFYGDGVTYWFTDTFQGPSNPTTITPAVGNLDIDPEPEIVVNMNQTLVVYEANGDIAWSQIFANEVGMPLLADLTGDGLLDIVAYDVDGNVKLYDYNLGAPQLLWQTPLSTSIGIVRGGPAVVDVVGDGTPEIAISHNGYHTVLDRDGNQVWSTRLDPGSPGGVSVADVDGDGEIEIVTGMQYNDGFGIGRLYALNADGSILWQRPAYDSTSANSQSVLDLNGDGIYEIAWNGAQYGFTIFNGVDGAILFNEPLAESLTATDYPIFADVDLDGFAEIVVPSNDGIRVFGFDNAWGPSRPLWNQHSYHITNINNDLTVPFSEFNSWDIHNTYRTQTDLTDPTPSYGVTLTYTAALTNVVVLTPTFSMTPTSTPPAYRWNYTQEWFQPVVTTTFDSLLTDMEPGEVRQVSQGTELVYTQPSGSNRLLLPPLYANAARIVALSPLSQTVAAGVTADTTITLFNPDLVASDIYSLSLAGLPSGWATLLPTTTVSAGELRHLSLPVAVPTDAIPGEYPFVVEVTNSAGGTDSAVASLSVIDGLDVAITPESVTAETGSLVTYTVTLTNLETVSRTYTLAAAGMADVVLPSPVTIPGNSAQSATITATSANEGRRPFTVSATASGSGATDNADAIFDGTGGLGVALGLSPGTGFGGPATPVAYNLFITNTGHLVDSYDLSVSLPAGWSHTLTSNGLAASPLTLAPAVFNSAELLLLVTPAPSATPGTYPFTVTAQSTSSVDVTAVSAGTLEVSDLGVQLKIVPDSSLIDPWQVVVTNTGTLPDTFDLSAAGIVAGSAQFTPSTISLNAGQSGTVSLTATNVSFLLPGDYLFAVTATSQADPRIQNEDVATLTVPGTEAVEVAWLPSTQTVTDTLSATLTLVISNTGNLVTTYQLSLDSPSLTGEFAVTELPIPPLGSAAIPVTLEATAAGTYTITGTVNSASSSATAADIGTLTFAESSRKLYLPIIVK